MKTIETFEQPGDVVTLVAPYDVTGGDGLLVGIIFGIAAYQVASGTPVETCTTGVFRINALSTDVGAQGAAVYWDNTNRRVTTSSSGNTAIGALVVAKQNGSAVAVVRVVSGDGTVLNLGSLLLSTFPVGIAPSGSVGANGALTLGTALNVIYSGGIFLHFPAGAVFSGSAAGLYYCVMSSTTVGTVYNNVGSGVPSAPTAPTPIVDAGPGAYTAPTGADITLITAPAISAGVFGLSGGFKAEVIGSNNNSASGKTTRFKLNSVNIGGATTSTSTNNSQSITFQNGGAANRNVVFFQNFGASAIGQARSATTVDTSAAMTLVVAAQLATVATDFVIVDTAIVKLLGNA